jgi:predicted dehydrogenase
MTVRIGVIGAGIMGADHVIRARAHDDARALIAEPDVDAVITSMRDGGRLVTVEAP